MTTPAPRAECLDDATLAAIAVAPPGQAPAGPAAHLASCARCQRRLLARSGDVAAVPPRGPAARPPLWRTVVVIAAMMVAILGALFVISRFGGR